MTSKEFAIWLQGFTVACHEYAPTPKQWDILKETLLSVTDVNGINNTDNPNRNIKTENYPQHSNIESAETGQSKLKDKFPF